MIPFLPSVLPVVILTVVSMISFHLIQAEYVVIAFRPTTPSESHSNTGAKSSQVRGQSAVPGDTSEEKIENATTWDHGIQGNGTSSLVTYENQAHGIKIKYPPDWRIVLGTHPYRITEGKLASNIAEIATFLPPIDDTVRVTLYREDMKYPINSTDIGNYLATAISRITGYKSPFPDFKIESSSGKEALSGAPAYVFVANYDNGGKKSYLMDTGTIQSTAENQRGYSIQFTGDEENYKRHLSTAQRMIDSLEVIK